MRLFCFFLISLFTLASCGDNKPEPLTVNGQDTVLFSGSGFQIQVPENWSSSGSSDVLPAPGNGQVTLISIAPEKKYNFSNNLLILEDTLSHIGSSKQYSEQNHIHTKQKYQEYRLIESSPILFTDSDESKYYVFDAKYNSQTPKMRFIQTAKICGTRVYLIHFALGFDANISEYIALSKTFACK